MRDFRFLLIVVGCAASLAAAAFAPLYLSLPMLGAWVSIILISKRMRGKVDDDAEVRLIVERIINLGHERRVIDILGDATEGTLGFGKQLMESVRSYSLSGDLEKIVSGNGNWKKESLAGVVKSALVNNDRSTFMLEIEELYAQIKMSDNLALKNHGAVSNSSFITSMGTSFFFPLFAGIGLNVMNFANSGISLKWEGAVEVAALSYIVLASYIAHSKKGLKNGAIYACFSSLLGITVFRIAALLTGNLV